MRKFDNNAQMLALQMHRQVCVRDFISWVQPPILTISSNLAIVAKLGDPKCL